MLGVALVHEWTYTECTRMPAFSQLPSGKWRAQVRRTRLYRAVTFGSKREARCSSRSARSISIMLMSGCSLRIGWRYKQHACHESTLSCEAFSWSMRGLNFKKSWMPFDNKRLKDRRQTLATAHFSK